MEAGQTLGGSTTDGLGQRLLLPRSEGQRPRRPGVRRPRPRRRAGGAAGRPRTEAEGAAWLAKRAEMEALDVSLDELNDLADLLAHAALLAAGFRRHKRGEWRKRREQ